VERNWSGWDNENKPWDHDRPFHRIHAPASLVRPGADPANGRGFSRGCRIPTDIPFSGLLERILSAIRDPREVIRTVPSWVAVEDQENLREVEGVLLRSYQTWTDFPMLQWHHWYDWNFFIDPMPDFAYLRGEANRPPEINAAEANGFTRPVIRDFDGAGARTMECEFDCGLMGARQPKIGPMFGQFTNPSSARSEDWVWPQAGQYAWIAGRWIYDCGHPTSDVKTGASPGLTRSELHPCKAVATARWEAVSFPENNNRFVPGIQFMFFTIRHGGYFNYNTLGGRDYEFIIDLPPVDGLGPPAAAVGHTPEFPFNTLVLRKPELLSKPHFEPYGGSMRVAKVQGGQPGGVVHRPLTFARIEPVVTLIEPMDPAKPQARVKIPLSSVGDADAYGVILSLGWKDPGGAQARSVKKVTVNNISIKVGDNDHDGFGRGSGEWVVKVGINGRWVMRHIEGVDAHDVIDFQNVRFEFFLPETESVNISAHGEELDDVHDVYKNRTDDQRVLRVEGIRPGDNVVQYFRDCVGGDLVMARRIVTAIQDEMTTEFVESDPLGRIDPHHGESINPLNIRNLAGRGRQPFALVAKPTSEVGRSAELAENTGAGLTDYTLRYSVEVTDQDTST